MRQLVKCKSCGKQVAPGAFTCPSCGEMHPGINLAKAFGIFFGVCAVIAIGIAIMAALGAPGPSGKLAEAPDNVSPEKLTGTYLMCRSAAELKAQRGAPLLAVKIADHDPPDAHDCAWAGGHEFKDMRDEGERIASFQLTDSTLLESPWTNGRWYAWRDQVQISQ